MARSIHTNELPRAYTLFSRFLSLWERIGDLFRAKRKDTSRSFRPSLERIEERIVPDGRPLPLPVIFLGTGDGPPPIVRGVDAITGDTVFSKTVFEPEFTGGVRVATGNFDSDGFPDIVASAGPGGGPHVVIMNGKTGDVIRSFYAFDENFTGGVEVAAVDVNGDSRINLTDFSILSYWFHRPSPPANVDENHDGKVDLTDLSILAYYWTG